MSEFPVPERLNGEINLHSTLDAKVWADEFVKRYSSLFCIIEGKEGVIADPDEVRHIMLGWFANAIMAGVDHTNWKNGNLPDCSIGESMELYNDEQIETSIKKD